MMVVPSNFAQSSLVKLHVESKLIIAITAVIDQEICEELMEYEVKSTYQFVKRKFEVTEVIRLIFEANYQPSSRS